MKDMSHVLKLIEHPHQQLYTGTFGECLFFARKKRGLLWTTLAGKLGLFWQAIPATENDVRQPSIDEVSMLAQILSCQFIAPGDTLSGAWMVQLYNKE